MNALIMGMGHIGKAVAARLRAAGHRVIGTTTTPARVTDLAQYADEIVVLRGAETGKVAQAARDCDAIIVTVAPDVKKSRTVEARHEHYADVLVASCESAAQACERVLFASSFSVYGDGGDGVEPVSESTPTANQEEPSARYYAAAEQAVLRLAGGCVLRFPDMYGAPGDLDFAQRVGLCHEHMGGKAIFSADAPLYTIHFEDVVDAIVHSLEQCLAGIYNVCDNDNLPHTNQQVFDAICAQEGLAPLTFLDQIKAPLKRISAEKLYATGYRVKHPDPNAQLL